MHMNRQTICWIMLLTGLGCLLSSCSQSNGASGINEKDIKPYQLPTLKGDSWQLDLSPGETTSYPMVVENIGKGSETYVISTTSQLGWVEPEMPLPATITLGTGESLTFPLRVTVPLTATPGMEDSFVMKFLRQADLYHDSMAILDVRIKP